MPFGNSWAKKIFFLRFSGCPSRSPQPFKGLLLSGMCVPDLRGSQGTFSFFSTDTDGDAPKFTGGEQTVLRRKGNVIRSRIVGPDNSMVKGGLRMTLPFTLTVSEDKKSATIEIDGCEPFELQAETYSPWIQLSFKPGLGITVAGIARFYLMSIDPHVNLYMTPIHIDPENPAMPISHPQVYSIYLAKKQVHLPPWAWLKTPGRSMNGSLTKKRSFKRHTIFRKNAKKCSSMP